MQRRFRSILITALALVMLGSTLTPATAQLVLVNEVFRIVEVDQANHRIGVARRDDNPNVRQNWVYVDIDTRGSYRIYIPSARAFRDKSVSGRQVLNIASKHIGQVMRVKGGRDWDGTIKAKTVYFKI